MKSQIRIQSAVPNPSHLLREMWIEMASRAYDWGSQMSHLLREMWIEIIRAKSDASGFTESSPAGDVD